MYTPFKTIPVGAKFGGQRGNPEWLKTSTRTARRTDMGRSYYFRQDDIVTYVQKIDPASKPSV